MTIEIGILVSIIGVLLAILTFTLNRDKTVKSEASRNAVIETKLDNISQGVESIRIDNRASEQRVRDLSERVVKVEESTKQAHKRLDNFENKGEM
ncbi:type II secretion system protein [Metabacillus niabensis]|uniref:Type II secretory pathway pseudopilin PulG n=1 Tax=Metabacillus niabensis TaxID=324854 RepID=A0ABT9Z824_9BACI|nr:hypothetical protein [Metabacillus niabensis]MDQ0228403.1 type II secretory pathway pseudopilin PulG [Metabacillus niabensis]